MTTATKVSGTCPCCFGAFVVKHDQMVLHGYKRPGHGYIIGNCPATRRFAPYEVSNEGTKYMLSLAAAALKGRWAYFVRLQKREITEFIVEVKKEGYYNAPKSVRYKMVDTITVRKGDGQKSESYSSREWYEEVLESRIRETEREISQIESDVKFLKGKIDSWQPINLNAKNTAVAKMEEAAKAKLCPGSNTHNHDSKGAHFYMKWAICNVCHTRVSLTSAHNLRKHEPKKVEA